jgi:hypothetical protein
MRNDLEGSTMTDELDQLLSRPLEESGDAGFTARVLTRIGRLRATTALSLPHGSRPRSALRRFCR